MTDTDLIRKRLAFIITYVGQLRSMVEIEDLAQKLKDRRFVEHTLQLAIQAALDIASHIVSDAKLGEPETNQELFKLLSENGWIPEDLVGRLRNMVGFRNAVVHGYLVIRLDVVEDVLRYHLPDLEAFVREIDSRIGP